MGLSERRLFNGGRLSRCYVRGGLPAVLWFFLNRYLWKVKMSSGVQPCFQLLRIGLSDTNDSNAQGNASSDSVRDLYTFRPALAQCVFRLGRATELCDVTLESMIVSRIHAELHVERETDASGEESWKVQVKDRSSYGVYCTFIYYIDVNVF